MGDGWQHKDDYPDDPNEWGRRTVRHTAKGRNLAAGEGNYEARKYKVNVQERGHGFQIVYIENGTNRAGAFTVDNHGNHNWPATSTQLYLVRKLRDNLLTEARAGSQYTTARGMIDNALMWSPGQGIQLPDSNYESEIKTFTDETEVRRENIQGTKNMSMMNTREAIALMQLHNGAKLYGVKFMAEGFVKPDQKTYTYKDVQGLGLAFNDLVVVEARDSVAIAQIVQLDVSPSASSVDIGKVRHIVQKIDMMAHNALLSRENAAVEKLAMAEVGERLDKYRQQLGGARFAEVSRMLGGDVQEEVNMDTVEVDIFHRLIDTTTGEVFGQLDARGMMGKRGYIAEGFFYHGDYSHATRLKVYPATPANAG